MSDAFVCQRLTAFGTAQGCDPAGSKKARPREYFFMPLTEGLPPKKQEASQFARVLAIHRHSSSQHSPYRFLFHELYYSEPIRLRVFTHKQLKFLTLMRVLVDIHKVVSTNSRVQNPSFRQLIGYASAKPVKKVFF